MDPVTAVTAGGLEERNVLISTDALEMELQWAVDWLVCTPLRAAAFKRKAKVPPVTVTLTTPMWSGKKPLLIPAYNTLAPEAKYPQALKPLCYNLWIGNYPQFNELARRTKGIIISGRIPERKLSFSPFLSFHVRSIVNVG
jgi:hypothetical protein